jgi:hypothetical protein
MQTKFGVEIELNSFDNRDFSCFPLKQGEIPEGTREVANLIRELGLQVEVQSWQHNHNNKIWICKPDASCGIEVCSPVLSEDNVGELFCVLDKLSKDNRIKQDDRCSFHIHVNVENFTTNNINASEKLSCILAWWLKCEHIFMDFATSKRKLNKFCRCIGLTDLFDHEEDVIPMVLVNKFSDKYLSLNTYHLTNKKRKTIEFRIFEGTLDSEFASKCIDLIMLFVKRSTSASLPENYSWIDVNDFFEFLNFEDPNLKFWFLNRLIFNCGEANCYFFSKTSRKQVMNEYLNLVQKL